ncbi:3-phosphoshikimate 1-carboxyvinyltransferase [endosymbiont of Sipalinus gigas]|uniref:3-phosphoshikimate 1-carboxyvinyltransferase n=1 Tax=endosymbiont of Sipalinus gigas TaxID=1972134 RepID=UPI000DC72668|nr:3-phosphoshikimate 1-carboxyvinyltransferase [endosymbiont of Sipalinus gigas]BBA85165.1 3-phosphoshikimate 1-carboxyvinyltransferase [endosymbiont of Sipalinus gigas]
MNNILTINPINEIYGSVNLPGSKSISNRALLISALTNEKTILSNILDSDDVNYMISSLKILGIKINKVSSNKIEIYGNKESIINKKNVELFIGNSGTTIRFLTSILSLGINNNITITGNNRMKERPIGDLVESLRMGGANIKFLENKNFPPININGGYSGGLITINGNISSQFLTSLLIVSPLAYNDSLIKINNNLVSKPYINITLSIMKSFGINIINKDYKEFYIKGKSNYISPKEYYIEGDATSASYFLAAGAIKSGPVKVFGVGSKSIQGDINFTNLISKMGGDIKFGDNFIESYNSSKLLKNIDADVNDIPDSAMTAVILSLFVNDKKISIFRNIYNWRLKETDRLSAMSNELKKIGAEIIEGKDFISIKPPNKFRYANIDTYDDHRIAMCFSLIPLSGIKIDIMNPDCVNKTFPNYFECLKSIIH